jgi:hypothetical protein
MVFIGIHSSLDGLRTKEKWDGEQWQLYNEIGSFQS